MIQNKTLFVAIAVISSPIIFAFVAYSETFTLSWNQGRGGFLFALAFIIAELIGLRIGIAKNRILAAIPLALIVIAYMILLENGLRDQIQSLASNFGIELLLSWVWMWDFIIMAVFTTVTLILFFGTKWIRIAPAGPIFLCGSAIILSLDAFFPYDALGPLQYFVPHLVNLNVWLVDLFNLGVANASGNMMFLKGDYGPFALQVFWPSAGVHSIIIYSLVMMAFLLKMRILPRRKLAWFGIFGTKENLDEKSGHISTMHQKVRMYHQLLKKNQVFNIAKYPPFPRILLMKIIFYQIYLECVNRFMKS